MTTAGSFGTYIPGTALKRETMGGVTGIEFLNKIFFITDGIMLAQLREISGVDGSTLQNWVKRGWIGNTVNKKYSKDQLARILIINMLRGTMQLERIDFLLHYINGAINHREDDIIPESMLYEYICRISDKLITDGNPGPISPEELRSVIEEVTSDYVDAMAGATRRLHAALEVIITAYYASLIMSYSAELYDRLEQRKTT
jgi:Domain of unknown function (DUF1836).